MQGDALKKCSACQQPKATSEFGKNRATNDGLQSYCRQCNREYFRAYGQTPELKAKRKKYWATAGKSIRQASNRLYRKKYPEKKSALNKVYWAKNKSETLKQTPCEICGDCESQAHHADYLKPLEVRWLCKTHHMHEHRVGGLR